MTEDEAKKKWCPFVRFTAPSSVDFAFSNRLAHHDQIEEGLGLRGKIETNCIGSACMAWRWDETNHRPPSEGRLGYCGAFGRPE